jgi:hypothetical protein
MLKLLYCLTFGWDAASGPVHHYDLSVDGAVQQQGVLETEASVCFSDLDSHTVSVQAFDIDGTPGPMSDGSDAVQMEVNPPLYVKVVSPVVQADLDGNGVVGMSDFGIWGSFFQKCHDGVDEVPCD